MIINFDLHNIIIESTCLLLLAILNYSRLCDRKQTCSKFKSFDSLLITCLIYIVFRLVVTLMILGGATSMAVYLMLLIINSLSYLAAYYFVLHASEVIPQHGEANPKLALANRIVFLLCYAALLWGFVTNRCYILYNDNSGYMRGQYYFIIFLYPLIANFAVVLFAAFSKIPVRIKLSLYTYFVFVVISLILQNSNPRISLIGIDVTLAAAMLYSNACLSDTIKLYEAEKILTEEKYRILMMQIQPHFLYNSLSTIQQLCVESPKEAEDALGHFSEFLRGNMDRLTRDRLVSFEDELALTENYIHLEKCRFGDRINIEYDIQSKDFMLPPASLQLAVENAIRYGVCKKIEGGTVRISSRATDSANIITVVDDGFGFNIDNSFDAGQATLGGDARSHIGLPNMRARLDYLCNGSVDIESTVGKGTKVTITIPKVTE